MKKITLDPLNYSNPVSNAIRNQLYINGIKIVEKNSPYQGIPSFRVLTSTLSQDVVSILQNGRAAEYQIVISVSANVFIPGYKNYPISAKVYRSFFDNPKTALAKHSERQFIINEMYEKVAEELIHKLLNIQFLHKKDANFTNLSD